MANDENEAPEQEVEYWLTTIDNPYDPFNQFNEWYSYDLAHCYHTLENLARTSIDVSQMSSANMTHFNNLAIDDFIKNQPFYCKDENSEPTRLYIKVCEADFRKMAKN